MQKKLADLIGESQIAMLTTVEPNGVQKMRELWTPWVEPSNVERLYGFAKAIATGDTRALGEHQKIRGPAH